MDTDNKLRKILGTLRGGRLEDVADTLLALFRAPEWWEEEFDKQCVAPGSSGALQDSDTCDAVKACIRTLLTRTQHAERQQFLRDIRQIHATVVAVAERPKRPLQCCNGPLCCCMPFNTSTGCPQPSQRVDETRIDTRKAACPTRWGTLVAGRVAACSLGCARPHVLGGRAGQTLPGGVG